MPASIRSEFSELCHQETPLIRRDAIELSKISQSTRTGYGCKHLCHVRIGLEIVNTKENYVIEENLQFRKIITIISNVASLKITVTENVFRPGRMVFARYRYRLQNKGINVHVVKKNLIQESVDRNCCNILVERRSVVFQDTRRSHLELFSVGRHPLLQYLNQQ